MAGGKEAGPEKFTRAPKKRHPGRREKDAGDARFRLTGKNGQSILNLKQNHAAFRRFSQKQEEERCHFTKKYRPR